MLQAASGAAGGRRASEKQVSQLTSGIRRAATGLGAAGGYGQHDVAGTACISSPRRSPTYAATSRL